MANAAPRRPQLRPVESIMVPDARYGQLLVLRDTQGIASGHACIPPRLVPIIGRFTGELTCEEIAREVTLELGVEVSTELVEKLAGELEQSFFLSGPKYRKARAQVEQEFATAPDRPASHAGGAYYADAHELKAYLDDECLGKGSALPAKAPRDLVGLVAPHIDPWRGAVGYGHSYRTLAARLPKAADTFILFGTSHAPMREPFALCRKSFLTPLGRMEADLEAIDALAKAAPFDVYADQFNHKREHSLEFQAVFLKHLLGQREARIIPVLAGLGHHQAHGTDPRTDGDVERFFEAIRELTASRPGRVVIIAGADMAHVGPRFGDPRPLAEKGRHELESADRASLACAADVDPSAFWEDVSRDLDKRRVCGLAPIYALLRALPKRAQGELLYYDQNIDSDDGSIVSHAGLGFFAS
jgi:MEMO1 family protein